MVNRIRKFSFSRNKTINVDRSLWEKLILRTQRRDDGKLSDDDSRWNN